ncbi:hypothetical protein EVAR_52019_1 [Eumeta japonica]|uniref:Uncharacterized protein n=1 Tax=Eumeta variegata TaxID=151549 RepID=A0A4C1YSV8_EUMVA|nr:hypothetical protein EVAR_52019_1 [Eumeta japonica]
MRSSLLSSPEQFTDPSATLSIQASSKPSTISRTLRPERLSIQRHRSSTILQLTYNAVSGSTDPPAGLDTGRLGFSVAVTIHVAEAQLVEILRAILLGQDSLYPIQVCLLALVHVGDAHH